MTQFDNDQDTSLLLTVFAFHESLFAVDAMRVQEIIRVGPITPVHHAPAHVLGVINLRGKVIPVVSLRARFGMERKEHDKDTRIVVVELRGMTVGFIVDAVNEVLRISRSVTEPPPALTASGSAEYITGVGKLGDRLLILLDLEKVVGVEEVEVIEAPPLFSPMSS